VRARIDIVEVSRAGWWICAEVAPQALGDARLEDLVAAITFALLKGRSYADHADCL
jgi:hypothetical protein